MLKVVEQEGARVHIEARGKLGAADYEAVVPALERQIDEQGPLRALIDLRALESVAPGAWFEEARFDLGHRRDVARCAVVGDRTWERRATELLAPIFAGPVRFFEGDALEDARRWLEG